MSTQEEPTSDRDQVSRMLGELDYVIERVKQFNTSESTSDTIAIDMIVDITRKAQYMLERLGGIELRKEIPASDQKLGG